MAEYTAMAIETKSGPNPTFATLEVIRSRMKRERTPQNFALFLDLMRVMLLGS
jgi:hypothetical protein